MEATATAADPRPPPSGGETAAAVVASQDEEGGEEQSLLEQLWQLSDLDPDVRLAALTAVLQGLQR